MFVDIAKIRIKAGNGGNGAISFHREKYVSAGGPDGGDGGKGGDIVFIADDNLSTLVDFRYKRKYIAKNGENGKAGRSSGKSADDLIIKVPRGTVIKDIQTNRIIADISSDEPEIVAKGGKGGWGNMHFATPTRQTPRFSKSGIIGIDMEISLELKLLADVGLVGYPNVGKSTLVSVVTEAKPVIADYHFTTITPVLGVVRMSEGSSFVMADIPGLIEGAGEGVGLGYQFLRHIDRCRMLIHIVDVSGSEGRDPKEDFDTINNELEKFNLDLAQRPMIVAGNKCDLASDDQIKDFKEFVEQKGYGFFPIMAAIGHDVDPLLKRVQEMLSKLPPVARYEIDPLPIVEEDKIGKNEVKVTKQDGIYFVESKWLCKLMENINLDEYDSLQYFQKVILNSGTMDALREAGAKEGDTVSIYDIEFDFID